MGAERIPRGKARHLPGVMAEEDSAGVEPMSQAAPASLK